MFITIELLQRHKACDAGLEFFKKFYPNGVEMIDIIRDKRVSKEILHWGRKMLTYNNEELEAYAQACNIINSEGYWYS